MRLLIPALLLLVSTSLFGWTTSGPHGGPANELEQSKSSPNVIYLASAGGVFRSDDRGVTWSDRGLTAIDVIAVDPVDPDIVFAASKGRSVSKSTDGGRTWRPVLHAMTTNIHIDPADRNVIYVGAHCEAFFKGVRPEFHERAGAYRSTDGGETWTPANEGLTGFALCIQELAVDPLASGTVFATYLEQGQAITTNRAETWTRASSPVATNVIVADPRTNIRYGFTGSFGAGFYASADGLQWTRTAAEGVTGLYEALTIDPTTGRLFLGTTEGIFRSGDGGNVWVRIANSPVQIRSLLFDASTSTLLAGTTNGIFRGNWATGEFTRVAMADHATNTENLAVDPTDPSTLYTASFDLFVNAVDVRGRVFRSTDGGASWETIHDGAVRNRIAVDARGDLYAAASGYGAAVFRLRKGSTVWEDTGWLIFDSSGLIAHPTKPGELWSLDINRVRFLTSAGFRVIDLTRPKDLSFARNGVVAYIASDEGFGITTDDGQTIRLLDIARTKVVAAAPSLPSTVYRVRISDPPVMNVVERSDDAAGTWSAVASFFDDVTDLAVDEAQPTTVWLSTGTGKVLRSTDGGATWRDETDDLPEALRIHRLELVGNMVHIATSAGVWSKKVNGRRRAVR
ncbi:MAG TPA: hypothetical protein VGF69_14690 [Thermoanaerobaculia bacterium]|jgi:hypothetical protein